MNKEVFEEISNLLTDRKILGVEDWYGFPFILFDTWILQIYCDWYCYENGKMKFKSNSDSYSKIIPELNKLLGDMTVAKAILSGEPTSLSLELEDQVIYNISPDDSIYENWLLIEMSEDRTVQRGKFYVF